MAEIRAFRGIRYTPQAGPIGSLTAPPYDVIGPEYRERLAAKSPRSIVHLILPSGGEERYRLAAEKLEAWLREGHMAQEREPALYLYRQTFAGPDGRSRMRTGFLGLLRLEAPGGSVRRHEQTMAKPLEDRLRLIRATRTQLSPILVLYSDPAGRASRAVESVVAHERAGPRPLVSSTPWRRSSELQPGTALEFNDDESVRHWFMPITDEQAIAEARRVLADLPIVIADGHHRYNAALEYRDRMKSAFPLEDPELPENFVLACFVRAEDTGLLAQPTHRIVPSDGLPAPDAASLLGSLGDRFEIHSIDLPASGGAEAAVGSLRAEPADHIVIGARLAGDPRLHVLILRPGEATFGRHELAKPLRRADAAVLQRLILEAEYGIDEAALAAGGHLLYERDTARAIAAADEGKARAVFLLRPLPVSTLFDLTAEGLMLPQKSTFFAPKLASGLVMHRLGV